MNEENLYAVSIFSNAVALEQPRVLKKGEFLDNGFFRDTAGGLWSYAVLVISEEKMGTQQVYAVSDTDEKTCLMHPQIRETGKFLPDGRFQAIMGNRIWRFAIAVEGGLYD